MSKVFNLESYRPLNNIERTLDASKERPFSKDGRFTSYCIDPWWSWWHCHGVKEEYPTMTRYRSRFQEQMWGSTEETTTTTTTASIFAPHVPSSSNGVGKVGDGGKF
jgi:hypothetical protein